MRAPAGIGVATTVGLAAVGAWWPVGAQTEAGAPFTAVAVAEAARKTVGVPPDVTLIETIADPGAPVAQAQVTLFGGNAFASTLYPGDTAANAPQLAAAAGLPVSPDYPFYVHAEHPLVPSRRVDGAPAYSMEAAAGANSARASAATGPSTGADDSIGRSHSDTDIGVRGDGTVVARAESRTEDARFGALRIATVHSTATATWKPGGAPPAIERTTRIEGASVNGVAIAIGPDGARLAETLVPLPSGDDTADELLAAQGIAVHTIEDPGDGGRGGHVVEVVLAPDVRTPEAHAGAIVRYRIGGARAVIEPGTAPGAPTVGSDTSFGLPGPGTGTATDTTVGALPTAGATTVATPAAAPTTTAGSGTERAAAAARLRLARDINAAVSDFYLLLVLTAFAALSIALTWRSTGSRPTWNS